MCTLGSEEMWVGMAFLIWGIVFLGFFKDDIFRRQKERENIHPLVHSMVEYPGLGQAKAWNFIRISHVSVGAQALRLSAAFTGVLARNWSIQDLN